MMPTCKYLAGLPIEEANNNPDKAKLKKLAIAGAGFGTGLIVIFLFYYALRGYLASKRTTKVGIPNPAVFNSKLPPVAAYPPPAPLPPANAAAVANAAAIRAQQEAAKASPLTPPPPYQK
jgi:hypothetical protein